MEWKTFLTTFGLVFLAELGDKTQLATMLIATQSKSLASVFLGSAGALVLSAFLGVLFGAVLTKYISPHLLQGGAGVAFILIGFLLIFGKF
ncbi:TMEM165/GDT1 family protein [Candidatus Contubernalis alkaliaceticus]|uniref:TMEM165/GDT1 family protein n=1 Tax=Candidatus Contubernalis alkaliaceticus TaxID=338645 RepID=UPI001F4BD4B2|nr:TMEM165/GDT1 family protein [Candidatus Contubernalis alkalaceticus]UNC92612.1 TMEM165/GDT1 family protein [Candidatus Contubernalis alkalaceticus]